MDKEIEALKPVCVPKRIVRNWTASVMRHCDYCSHYKDTVLNDDGSAICASCCDSEHSGNLQCALEDAIQRNAELIAALEQAQHKAVRDSQRKIELEVDLVDANGRLLELHKRIAGLEAAPNGMMQLSNELAEMLVEKLPSKSKLSLLASSHHRSYGDGFNVGIEKCAEAIRAAVGMLKGVSEMEAMMKSATYEPLHSYY